MLRNLRFLHPQKMNWFKPRDEDDIEVISIFGDDDSSIHSSNREIPSFPPVKNFETEAVYKDLYQSLNVAAKPILTDVNLHKLVGEFETDDGTAFTVTEEIPLSRAPSRSKSPFKIRDNINYLFGWDKTPIPLDDDPHEEIHNYELSRVNDLHLDRTSLEMPALNYHYPASRLALLSPEQTHTFNFELNYIRQRSDNFPLYDQWVIYCVEDKSFTQLGGFDDSKRLSVGFKEIKKKYNESKIILCKIDTPPKKSHPRNKESSTLDFKVCHDHDYNIFKRIVKLVVCQLLIHLDLNRM